MQNVQRHDCLCCMSACVACLLPPQALLGLSYMHSRKLIHRDIKSLNLFLDAADNIKVRGLAARTCCLLAVPLLSSSNS